MRTVAQPPVKPEFLKLHGLLPINAVVVSCDLDSIEKNLDYQAVKPESAAYGRYADAQAKELIARYKPSVLWNDIDWPKSGKNDKSPMRSRTLDLKRL